MAFEGGEEMKKELMELIAESLRFAEIILDAKAEICDYENIQFIYKFEQERNRKALAAINSELIKK
jgi:hypothetical protein|tara:strand:+ start:1035 stop:1232 length:198 start_codon:yes stop_codon:yes gene_type:complete